MTTTTRTPADVLREMRDLLAVPERWTQKVFARNQRGRSVESHWPSATCWCIEGASRRLTRFEPALRVGVDRALSTALGGHAPWAWMSWQDAPDRTHAEVLDLLDRAIEVAEGAR